MAQFTHESVAALAAHTQQQGITLPSDQRAYESLRSHRGADPSVDQAISQRWERDRAPTFGEAVRPLAILGAHVFIGVLAERRVAGEGFTDAWTEMAEASGGVSVVPDWDLSESLTRPPGRRRSAREGCEVRP